MQSQNGEAGKLTLAGRAGIKAKKKKKHVSQVLINYSVDKIR